MRFIRLEAQVVHIAYIAGNTIKNMMLGRVIIITILQYITRPTIATLLFLVSLKWGDWKNWRKYYSTILYIIVWDLLYNVFFIFNHPLWKLEHPLFKHTFSDIIIVFVVFPSSILLYLPHIPKNLFKQILHIIFWIFLFSLIETIAMFEGTISYHNGWNILWSIGFNFVLFTMVRLHYEHPILVWPISILLFIIAMIIFKLPIGSLL